MDTYLGRWVKSLQCAYHIDVITLDIDLEVVRYAMGFKKRLRPDTFNGDFKISCPISGSPTLIEAAPVIIVEVGIENKLPLLSGQADWLNDQLA
jgi:hypothetical protein